MAIGQQKVDILCISTIDWDFIWQGHQEIMSRFAADGHRVLFVENTGVRAPKVRDLPRIGQRLRNWRKGTKGFREERPNLFVFSPIVLPLPYSRVARWLNRQIIMRALRRWMRATGFYRPIAWTFLPTPLALDLLGEMDPQLTIYYCIDDLQSSSPGARRIVASEERLFREADLVFVTSEKLRERAARYSDRVHLYPFAVNFEQFERVRAADTPVPEDLAVLKPPVVGYVGGLHQWVDQDLLVGLAQAMPDVSIALVGPHQVDVSKLAACPNITLYGQRPHTLVPAYVKGFDVGLVPYRITDYTANVYPTKLNEYLVMGIPVVATDLAEIRRFNREHGDMVRVGGTVETFTAAVRDALATPSTPAEQARRVEVAESNSWESRISSMGVRIDEALAKRAAASPRWDETLRRVYRRTRGHLMPALVAVLAAYLLVFETNLVWWAASPLKRSAPPAKADAIVVFAGGVGESGRAGGGAQERLRQAVDLYKSGFAPVMILSSGYVYSYQEAEVMRATAIDQGVPAAAIMLETRATNTYQNVRFVDDILRDRRWHRILLVSSPYHMRRALLVWNKVAPEVNVVPTPGPVSDFYQHDRGATFEQVRALLQEYVSIVAYWRRGWA